MAMLTRHNSLTYFTQPQNCLERCVGLYYEGSTWTNMRMMLDGGANINLISEAVCGQLGIPVGPTTVRLTTSVEHGSSVVGITPAVALMYGVGLEAPLTVWHYFLVTRGMDKLYQVLVGNLDTELFGAVMDSGLQRLTLRTQYKHMGGASPTVVLDICQRIPMRQGEASGDLSTMIAVAMGAVVSQDWSQLVPVSRDDWQALIRWIKRGGAERRSGCLVGQMPMAGRPEWSELAAQPSQLAWGGSSTLLEAQEQALAVQAGPTVGGSQAPLTMLCVAPWTAHVRCRQCGNEQQAIGGRSAILWPPVCNRCLERDWSSPLQQPLTEVGALVLASYLKPTVGLMERPTVSYTLGQCVICHEPAQRDSAMCGCCAARIRGLQLQDQLVMLEVQTSLAEPAVWPEGEDLEEHAAFRVFMEQYQQEGWLSTTFGNVLLSCKWANQVVTLQARGGDAWWRSVQRPDLVSTEQGSTDRLIKGDRQRMYMMQAVLVEHLHALYLRDVGLVSIDRVVSAFWHAMAKTGRGTVRFKLQKIQQPGLSLQRYGPKEHLNQVCSQAYGMHANGALMVATLAASLLLHPEQFRAVFRSPLMCHQALLSASRLVVDDISVPHDPRATPRGRNMPFRLWNSQVIDLGGIPLERIHRVELLLSMLARSDCFLDMQSWEHPRSRDAEALARDSILESGQASLAIGAAIEYAMQVAQPPLVTAATGLVHPFSMEAVWLAPLELPNTEGSSRVELAAAMVLNVIWQVFQDQQRIKDMMQSNSLDSALGTERFRLVRHRIRGAWEPNEGLTAAWNGIRDLSDFLLQNATAAVAPPLPSGEAGQLGTILLGSPDRSGVNILELGAQVLGPISAAAGAALAAPKVP
jgi:hypothetical protein